MSDPIPYRIVGQKDLSYPGTKRLSIDVEVQGDGLPEADAMQEIAEAVWEGHAAGFDQGWVNLFAPGIDHSLGAYGVATFKGGELDGLQVREELQKLMEMLKSGKIER